MVDFVKKFNPDSEQKKNFNLTLLYDLNSTIEMGVKAMKRP